MAAIIGQRRCETCKAYEPEIAMDPDEPPKPGYCHAGPPSTSSFAVMLMRKSPILGGKPEPFMDIQHATTFPRVWPVQWCLKHEPVA